MDKIDELNTELAEMRSKYNTAVTRKAVLICAVISFLLGLGAGYLLFHNYAEIVHTPAIKEVVQQQTKTEIVYVPKVADEKTDVDVNVGKQELFVKVNGREQVIQKADDEKYVFDKNKIKLDQTSKTTLDINIPVIDKTRHWGIGVGVGNNGIAYNVKFPIKRNMGGWAFHDNKTNAAGIMIEF